jgi:hypothetical protein
MKGQTAVLVVNHRTRHERVMFPFLIQVAIHYVSNNVGKADSQELATNFLTVAACSSDSLGLDAST